MKKSSTQVKKVNFLCYGLFWLCFLYSIWEKKLNQSVNLVSLSAYPVQQNGRSSKHLYSWNRTLKGDNINNLQKMDARVIYLSLSEKKSRKER